MPSSSHRRHDVVVVGARAAGSATALLLARMGHDVAVLERAQFPSDTLSTHSISRSGVVQLSRWGLLDRVLASGTPAIRQVTFHVGGESVTRPIKRHAGVDLLVVPRRHVLDTIVADAAQASGAVVRFGATVTGLRHEGGRTVGVTARDAAGAPFELDARFVVGADGLRSRVARSVGASIDVAGHSDGATHYAYYAGPEWQGHEFIVADGSFAGVSPPTTARRASGSAARRTMPP
jgi:2-polyprenyl-6-methoxyphenol hydroxylase-like FAD-dependent oxidoreductase